MKYQDKNALQLWEAYRLNIVNSTPVPEETYKEKQERINRQERNLEEWFRWYFPNYYSCPAAGFHIKASKRLVNANRLYEVRAWSRDLAKSTRAMFEVLYMACTGKCKNVLLVSHSWENAADLLMPFMINLESNHRLINDYGTQKGLLKWELGRFVTSKNVSFRCLGAGQSPRGSRNQEARPDVILIDDIDKDKKSDKLIDDLWKWIERALIPTVSVNSNYKILFLGNIIHKNGVIVRASRVADYFEVINIRNKEGISSWPEKNSEKDIDDILHKMSYISAQQEYFNNPITEGQVFDEMHYKKLPALSKYPFLVSYIDPSFKDSKRNDYKALVLMGRQKNEYHIIKAYCEQTNTADMAKWMKAIHDMVGGNPPVYYYMESSATQELLLEDVKKVILENKWSFMVMGDMRKKGDKFSRIESALQPLNSNGLLFLNEAEKNNPHMQRLEDQFLALEPSLSAHDDGPDAAEGAKYIIDRKIIALNPPTIGKRNSFLQNSKRY